MSSDFLTTLDFIEKLKNAACVTDVLRVMRSAGSEFGYDYFIITNLPLDESSSTASCAMLPSWPDGWRRRYFEKDYLRVDPVARRVKNTTLPFLWSEAPYTNEERRAAAVMNEATEFGLNAGLCVPIHHILGRGGGVSFGAKLLDLSPDATAALHMLSMYAFERTEALLRAASGAPTKRNPNLSPRETECLKWTAAGKTSWETSEILAISQRTVEFHLKAAAYKLDAVNRVQAVAEAMRYGLIA